MRRFIARLISFDNDFLFIIYIIFKILFPRTQIAFIYTPGSTYFQRW